MTDANSTSGGLISDAFRLNALLRGELAAAASYAQAMEHVSSEATRHTLESIRASHAARALALSSLVREAGGEPVENGGVWGRLAKAAERAASAFNDRAVLETLLQGEQLGLQTYLSQMSELDGERPSGELFNNAVLEQRRTERRLASLIDAREAS